MMPQAYRAWDLLWSDLGVSHYEETGGIYVLRQRDSWYQSTTTALAELGVSFRDLAKTELAERLPMLEIDGVDRAVWVAGSGILFPTRILTGLVVHLARLGVRFHASSRVVSVDPDAGSVMTEKGVFSGDEVAVAAGAWIDRLTPSFKGAAVPSRQAVVYLAPPPEFAEAWASAPVVVVRDGPTGLYTLPPRRGTRLKIGDHRFSRTGDPDEDRTATANDVKPLWEGLRRSYVAIDRYDVLEEKACFYTVTDDEAFKVEKLGRHGWAVSACSGHGFKFGPLMGIGVAAGVVGDIEPTAVTRWAAGRQADLALIPQ
jgi:sarcosine oxidase/sarcosine oxidase subunit beta